MLQIGNNEASAKIETNAHMRNNWRRGYKYDFIVSASCVKMRLHHIKPME